MVAWYYTNPLNPNLPVTTDLIMQVNVRTTTTTTTTTYAEEHFFVCDRISVLTPSLRLAWCMILSTAEEQRRFTLHENYLYL